jgi:hypothetical protein
MGKIHDEVNYQTNNAEKKARLEKHKLRGYLYGHEKDNRLSHDSAGSALSICFGNVIWRGDKDCK